MKVKDEKKLCRLKPKGHSIKKIQLQTFVYLIEPHEAEIDRGERRNNQFNNNSWKLQYLTFNMDRTTRQRIIKETEDLKNTINQLDLIDLYRTFYATKAEYTFYSSAYGTFP